MRAAMAWCVDEVCLMMWMQLCDRMGSTKTKGLECVK